MTWRRSVVMAAVLAVVAGLMAMLVARRTSTGGVEAIGANSIVMLGDSITEQADWASLLPEYPIVNQGHSGYTTEQLVPVAELVAAGQPRAVFVLTGTNDIRDGRSAEWTAERLALLLDAFETESPVTTVIVQTVLPRDDRTAAVEGANAAIRAVAEARGLRVVDLHTPFDNGAGGLRPEETTDGIHLSAAGYRRWVALVSPVIAGLDGD